MKSGMAGNGTGHPAHSMTSEQEATKIVGTLKRLLDAGKFENKGKLLVDALQKGNKKEVKDLSTKIIFGSVDIRKRASTLTTNELKTLMEMADKEKLRQDLHSKGCDKFQTASGDLIEEENTSVGFGPSQPGKTSQQEGENPAEPSTGRIPKEDDEIKQIQKLLDDRAREIDELKGEYNKAEKMNKQKLAEKDDVINTLKEQLKVALSEKGEMERRSAGLEKNLRDTKIEKENHCKKLEEEKKEFTKRISEEYKVNAEMIIQQKKDEAEKRHAKEIRQMKEKLKETTEERDDLKTRFSKLAGERLTDQNADIADLSDPNRAMKLSERFGQLYDDEWTDAFEYLKKKKMAVKDAVTLLIRMLKDCLKYCTRLRDEQMDSLRNVLLHPSQEMSQFSSEPSKNIAGIKDRPEISSKDQGVVCELRRRIGVYDSVINEVKRRFVQENKTWDKLGYDKKHIEDCSPYLQKCVEICWLMVIHCPPLYIKLDVKQGDALDLNYFSNYAIPSEKIDFLVWPPLFNEKSGGLLKKGVAEGMKDARKK